MALKTKSTKKKGGFVYKERSLESVKQRAERQGGRFDTPFKGNIDVYRPKTGDNVLRILPPTWEDPEHYGYEIWVHKFIGPDNSTYLCPRRMLNKKCPICEAEKAARDAQEKEEAKALAPVSQYAAWTLDREEDDDTPPKVYPFSWTMDRDIVTLCIDKRKGSVLPVDNPDIGYDLTFKRSGTGLKTKYYGYAFDRDPSAISDDDSRYQEIMEFITENPIPSVLKYHTYEYLSNALEGGAEESEEEITDEGDDQVDGQVDGDTDETDEDEATTRRPARGGRDARKPARRTSDDASEEESPIDEEDPDSEPDEEESEPDERPTRGRHRTKPRREDPVDEEDYETEEETTDDVEETEPEEEQPRRRTHTARTAPSKMRRR